MTTENCHGDYSKHFFERWEQTQTLIFEFTIFNMQNKPLFALKGLWTKNKWHKLEILPSNHIEIAPPLK